MKKLRQFILALPIWVALLALGGPVQAQTPAIAGPLTVKVTGLKSTAGKLVVNIYRMSDDLFGTPYLSRRAAITETTAVLVFANLAYSDYVALAFHDENDNGILDHNWLHIPKEPMGYSNNWRFGPLTGMPTFKKTSFVFSRNNPTVTVMVK